MSNLDHFRLPRTIQQGLRKCCTASDSAEPAEPGRIPYLWLYFTSSPESGVVLSTEEWLNVLDEAASLGVSWVVLSVDSAVSGLPQVWELCRWAQETHGMTVAFHPCSGTLPPEDVDRIADLDASRTCLFLGHEHIRALRHLEESGVRLFVADPNREERPTVCSMPESMLFVNPEGKMYTCGMVKGNDHFHLGSALSDRFAEVVGDPSLPHRVPCDAAQAVHGCDGCPPLVAKEARG